MVLSVLVGMNMIVRLLSISSSLSRPLVFDPMRTSALSMLGIPYYNNLERPTTFRSKAFGDLHYLSPESVLVSNSTRLIQSSGLSKQTNNSRDKNVVYNHYNRNSALYQNEDRAKSVSQSSANGSS